MMQRIVHTIIVFFCLSAAAALAQTQEQLVAGAKKEGALVVYASATAQQLQMYFAAFNKKYPFIKTEFFRTGKQKLVSKVLLEEQAKQRIADIIHTSVIETNIIKKKNGLSRYVPKETSVLPSQYKDPEGFWTSAYASGTLLGYNSRQVKRAEVPKKYEDLLDPHWKNNIAIDVNKIEWFAMLLKLKGSRFMEKLAAQKPTPQNGNTLILQMLAAGEFPISAGVYEYSVDDMKTKGAPVDWIGLEPVITYTVAVSLPHSHRILIPPNCLSNGYCRRKARKSSTSTGASRFGTTSNRVTAKSSNSISCS